VIGSCFGALRRKHVGENETVTLDDFTYAHAHRPRKHGAVVREGVEFAAFTAGISRWW
jgi:hypothetical protein